MDILVSGGTGFLGQHLTQALLDQGHRVRLMGRNFAPVQSLLSAGASPVPVDLRDKSAVIDACANVETVYHVGALSAPWGKRSDFFAINVGGTEAMIAGCLKHRVRRFIYVSSPSVVFNGLDQFNVTEKVPYPPRFPSIYSLTKKLGEDAANRAAADMETVILRPKAIFGPGDQSLLPRLISAARQGRLPQIGDGRNLVDLTYVENVVHALVLSLTASKAIGKTYTITNDEHAPLWEVIRVVLKRLNLSTQLRRVPLSVALAAGSLMEMRAALTGKEPLMTRYSAAILGRTQTYDIGAARRDLGYAPCVMFADGMERTITAM